MQSFRDLSRSLGARAAAAYMLTVALALVIGYLTLSPNVVPPPNVFQGIDKVYHIIGFSALMLPSAVLYPRVLFWTIPAASLFAGAIEINFSLTAPALCITTMKHHNRDFLPTQFYVS